MAQPQQSHRPTLRPVLEAYVNVTAASYTAKAGDRIIGVNRAGTVTVTLPTAEVRKGRNYTVKDESGAAATNNITVTTQGSDTIDGSATDTIAEDYGSKIYYSDGSNWFTVPLLPTVAVAHSATTGQGTDDHHAQAHTLASHSTEAHSELTGVGTDDHHTQAHTVASHSDTTATGAELETLTNGSETTLHSHAGGGGAVTRAGGNTTEATTTSNTMADVLSVASLSVAAATPVKTMAGVRKTSGAAESSTFGIKFNATIVLDGYVWTEATTTDQVEETIFLGNYIYGLTNYTHAGIFQQQSSQQTADYGTTTSRLHLPLFDGAMPTTTFTDWVIRLRIGSSLTVGADDAHVYSYSVS